ncbi:hypothetical protein PPYR_00445 [Photinus pyralis]|uniref:E3 ubiquitin-protein ligase APD1-4 middle domain-containing protein n=1 Tax=Photinus pyralis TaxID=7054 RepID=A0A1Y1N8L9_PHOPY|nr:uncharacterized protein LOC116159681 [Photinus pyralis]KAB0803475.1 hypothetical protein PPYR_00445 [Photinus pyralis]
MTVVVRLDEAPIHKVSPVRKRPRSFKGPLRVLRLCLLGIALPMALVSVPLYLRYHVYANQLYPFAVSDMRLLDRRISTFWCQSQVVKVNDNATFNAFLLPQDPPMAPTLKPVSMVREIYLEDDMKEYWGFYLLAGSTVTVSTCVRWPGASLIIIRGHKHLHDCAYIGDDSSEELEEIAKGLMDGTYNDSSNSSAESDTNTPHLMKRHRSDVHFHHPYHSNGTNATVGLKHDVPDITDPKMLKVLLEALSKKTQKMNEQREKIIEKIERQKGSKKTFQKNSPKEEPPTSYVKTNSSASPGSANVQSDTVVFENLTVSDKDIAILQASVISEIKDEAGRQTASDELYMELSKKLDSLGDKQHKILQKLNERAAGLSPLDKGQIRGRRKREITISSAMHDMLNADDDEGNIAIEEGFQVDGIADHHGEINETTLNDRSSSEFWSSFSSSEEALLNCEGLVLNLPLTPHMRCNAHLSEESFDEASSTNKVTYQIPSNGYYFFIFNSENEVQVNYIRLRFQLNKTVYDVSSRTSFCENQTNSCALDLKFFSNEKTVMEVPITSNQSRWNEEFVVVSECQPRTIIYMCCAVSVPILIMLFAFQ